MWLQKWHAAIMRNATTGKGLVSHGSVRNFGRRRITLAVGTALDILSQDIPKCRRTYHKIAMSSQKSPKSPKSPKTGSSPQSRQSPEGNTEQLSELGEQPAETQIPFV